MQVNFNDFDEILHIVKEDITKYSTQLREPIPAEVKLAITIRFLATGQSYQELSTCFRVHKSTIVKFVPEVCDAIYGKLKVYYLKVDSFSNIFILQKFQITTRCRHSRLRMIDHLWS